MTSNQGGAASSTCRPNVFQGISQGRRGRADVSGINPSLTLPSTEYSVLSTRYFVPTSRRRAHRLVLGADLLFDPGVSASHALFERNLRLPAEDLPQTIVV